MDVNELERVLRVAGGHSIIIDARLAVEAEGYVRLTQIHEDASVTIEFVRAADYSFGEDDGALKLVGEFPDVRAAAACLERFLGKPIAAWRDFSASPLELADNMPAADLPKLEELVKARAVPVPTDGRFYLAGIHWRHLERYGEYRHDKWEEEQQEFLERQYGDVGEKEDE
jgi:hypothetical protein